MTAMKYDFAHLYQFCTRRQHEILSVVEKNQSATVSAAELGIQIRNVFAAIQNAKKRAALQGVSPEHDMTKPAPEGYIVKGTSTYYDKDGKLRGQWVKTDIDRRRQEELIKEACAALAEDLPAYPSRPTPLFTNQELLNVYTFTDCHVGMLAWEEEGGAEWNLEISERVLTSALTTMIQRSPQARSCVIAQLGDWLHQDSYQPVTPTSGHILDSAATFGLMVKVAVRILRRMIDAALDAHEEVYVLMAQGNHDISSALWLRHVFEAVYERNPRVKFVSSEVPFYALHHGNTMLAWHHGHRKKNDSLPLLFAAQYPKIWGSTEKRYCHTGHRHHVEEKEHSGMTVIQHPTLAARDAYASHGGWLSDRAATSITYHTRYGQVARNTVCPEMLR